MSHARISSQLHPFKSNRISYLHIIHQALDLALANMDKILSQAGEKSADREIVDGVLNVVCFLLQRVLENASSGKAPDEAVKLVESFIGKLAADTPHAALRLKVHR